MFWTVFALAYFAQPMMDFVIFRRLWGIGLILFLVRWLEMLAVAVFASYVPARRVTRRGRSGRARGRARRGLARAA